MQLFPTELLGRYVIYFHIKLYMSSASVSLFIPIKPKTK